MSLNIKSTPAEAGEANRGGATTTETETAFSPRQRYWQLLTRRYSEGLLAPFSCAECGVVALDPVGWNGTYKPLCDRCADAGSGGAPDRTLGVLVVS
jgi:hypothetical protein